MGASNDHGMDVSSPTCYLNESALQNEAPTNDPLDLKVAIIGAGTCICDIRLLLSTGIATALYPSVQLPNAVVII
jgi:hypothetical protein